MPLPPNIDDMIAALKRGETVSFHGIVSKDEDEGFICDACDGEGWIRNEDYNHECRECNGDGRVWE